MIRPRISQEPMPIAAQRMAEARAKLYRATPLFDITDLKASDVNTALKGTLFADDEPFDAEAFVDEVCG